MNREANEPKQKRCAIDPSHVLISAASNFAVYYYRKYIDENYGFVRSDVMKHVEGRLSTARPTDFESVHEYWKHVRMESKGRCKLADLALVVLSFAANAATCERMFSDLGNIHTPTRNRMAHEKALKIHTIRQHSIREHAQDTNHTMPQAPGDRLPNRIIKPTDRERVAVIDLADQQEEDDESVDVEDTLDFWNGVLGDIFTDPHLEEDYIVKNPPHRIDPYEAIAPAARPEPPDENDSSIQQEVIRGIRAWNINLAELFPLSRPSRNETL